MINWITFLRKDKIIFNYILIFTIFLIALVIFSPFYEYTSGLIIQILISIIVSILSAVLILYFSYYQHVHIKLNRTFKELYEEIKNNKSLLDLNFNKDSDDLELRWKNGIKEIGGGKGLWLKKSENKYPSRNLFLSKYSWRYLELHPHVILNNYEFLEEIADYNLNIDTISIFWDYPKTCNTFCDKIQELESLANIQSYYIGRLKEQNEDKSNFPEIILLNNIYYSTGKIIEIHIRDCEDKISKIIKDMKDIKNDFMNEFNKYYNLTEKYKKLDFVKCLLNEGVEEKESSIQRILFSRDIHYCFLISIILFFVIYSTIKYNRDLLIEVNILPNNCYWVIIWIILFLFMLLLKRIIKDD